VDEAILAALLGALPDGQAQWTGDRVHATVCNCCRAWSLRSA
jgi:hypothetical protein